MANGAKVAHDFFLSTGALTYFSLGDFANIAKGGIDVVGSGISNAYDQSEGQFREAGQGVGEIVGSVGNAIANLAFLKHTADIYGKSKTWFGTDFNGTFGPGRVTEAKALMSGNGHYGAVYNVMENGGYQKVADINRGKFSLAAEAQAIVEEEGQIGKALGKHGVGGYWQNGSNQFVKSQGFIRGLAPFAAAWAIGFAAKGILGFAGSLMDESVKDYKREKRVHYDNRFFNSQRDEMSNMQTLGAAMNNYESRYQSTSRIYHSR